MIEMMMNDGDAEDDGMMNEGGEGSSMTEESELMEGGGMIEDKEGKGLVE